MWAKFASWVGLNVLLPWLTKTAKALYKKIKAKMAWKEKVKEAERTNTEYENNPSDDTFGNSN